MFDFITVCQLECPVVLRLRHPATSRMMSCCERWGQNLVRADQTRQTGGHKLQCSELSWTACAAWAAEYDTVSAVETRHQTEPVKRGWVCSGSWFGSGGRHGGREVSHRGDSRLRLCGHEAVHSRLHKEVERRQKQVLSYKAWRSDPSDPLLPKGSKTCQNGTPKGRKNSNTWKGGCISHSNHEGG